MMMQMQEQKKMKVKKGCVAVQVGIFNGDEQIQDCSTFQRFIIPISYLYTPLFQKLLEESHEMYGFHNHGLLTLPCSIDYFLQIQSQMERSSKHNGCRKHRLWRMAAASLSDVS
ncbi:hypothetical protein C2S51_006363 [Perilla frutescens var. frutescens]|nr:hypothetical protein C2S51_006363 [Perilla frutescens var. frutescens]